MCVGGLTEKSHLMLHDFWQTLRCVMSCISSLCVGIFFLLSTETSFIEEIIREVQKELRISLSQEIRDRLKSRYKNLHERLASHPALQERRLWVGRLKPTFDPEPIGSVNTKHRRHLAIPDESCPTQRVWELVNETIDINGRKVEVIQEQDAMQYVFVYRCQSSSVPCAGINNKYRSECEMRPGWAMLYHRIKDEPESEAIWDFVAIPHHCACKIIQKINF